MDGVGRARVLAVFASDPVMSAIAPVGLAVSAGTALLIDRIGGRGSSAGRTLADMISDGPRLDEISPGRPGVAVLDSGPLGVDETVSAAERLASRWPAVVVRTNDDWPGPTVPVHVLYGSRLNTWEQGAAVWQPLSPGARPLGAGPVLPSLSSRLVREMLNGWLPRPHRWVRAWGQVWEMPWA